MNSDVREWFNEGFQKGRKEREAEIIELIDGKIGQGMSCCSMSIAKLIKQIKEKEQ